MITRKLYEEDSYCKEFEAVVVECIEIEQGFQVILDQTAFFPEGGGQPPDKGTIQGKEVLDVQEDGNYIYHTVAMAIPVGTKVKGILDWETRFRIMQNHTGEHMVTGMIHERFGYDNVGFHMGSEFVTLDLNGTLSLKELEEIEEQVNRRIQENRKVFAVYPTGKEAEEMQYRSKKEITSDLRVLFIEGIDICACCGTHVNRTGEVGVVKLLGMQSYKGGVRISMVAGMDAVEDYSRKHQQITELSRLLSAKIPDVSEAVRKLYEEQSELRGKILKLQNHLLEEKAKHISEDVTYYFSEEEFQGNELRQYANLLLEKIPFVMVLSVKKDTEYSYLIGSKKKDCRTLGTAINQNFQGKGGGSPVMVQGSLKGDLNKIKEFFIEWVTKEE